MQILPSVAHRAPEVDLMQTVVAASVLLHLPGAAEEWRVVGFLCARHSKSMTYAPNPGAFMSDHSKCLQSFDAQIN